MYFCTNLWHNLKLLMESSMQNILTGKMEKRQINFTAYNFLKSVIKIFKMIVNMYIQS